MSQAVVPTANTDIAPQFDEPEVQGIIKALDNDTRCSNCQQLMTGEDFWCQSCGYYRALGTFVETPTEESRSDSDEAAYTRDWIRCAAAASIMIVLVVGCSVAARLLTAQYSAERFWYSLAQVSVGCAMALSAHIAAWVWGLLNADDVRIADLVINPIDLWRVTMDQLPKSWRRMSIGGGGLLAILLGLTIVEGVTLGHLTGTRDIPPKPQLLRSVVAQATAAGRAQDDGQSQPQTLEEAIEKFADQGLESTEGVAEDDRAYNPWDDVTEDGKDDDSKTNERDETPAEPEVVVKCVIVGYTVDDKGRVDGLLTAAMYRGRLTYAATVIDGVSERLPASLTQQLKQLIQGKSPIECPAGQRKVVWVRPAATCRIRCHGVGQNGELVGPVFSES